MVFLKFVDIPQKNSAVSVMKRICKALRLSKKQKQECYLIHVEEKERRQYDLRLCADYKLINMIKNNAELDEDRNMFVLRSHGETVKFKEVSEQDETFKTQRVPPNNNKSNLILWMKMRKDDSLIDVLNIVGSDFNINYISKKRE